MESTWNTSLELDLAEGSRRRLRRALVGSACAHLVVVVLLALRPAPEPIVLPSALTIDLVARVPVPQQAAPAKAKTAPAPAPSKPVPAPPPPQAKILPKRAPEAMVKPRPAPERVQRRPRPDEMELGDAMAALRSELGESVPSPAEAAPADSLDVPVSEGAEASAGTVSVSPEVMAWMNETRRHIQTRWVNPPEFLNRGYVTEVSVELRADGTVVGEPKVRRSSGDPYADENAVRALGKSSPLPPPPAPGVQIFIFKPEARS